MNVNKQLVLSFGLYGLGLLSFFLADLYIVANYPSDIVTQWAFYKSTLFIAASVCILGLDQVIIRTPNQSKKIFIAFLVQSTLVCCILYIASTVFLTLAISTLQLIMSVYFLSILTMISAIFRANHLLTLAQLATNGWKIAILTCMVLSLLNVESWFTASLSILLLFSLYYLNKTKIINKTITHNTIQESNHRNVGLAFFFHNITLVVAIYGEQMLINALGHQKTAYILYTHFVMFSSIAISFFGFFGFYLAPKIKTMDVFTLHTFKAYSVKLFIVSIALSTLSIAFGFLIYKLYYQDKGIQLEPSIIISIFIMCIARGSYTVSSICLGLFARHETLAFTAKLNWLFMLTYLTIIYLLLTKSLPIYILFTSISATTAIHWSVRAFVSQRYARLALIEKEKLCV
ncbi:hypothetical protein [Thalassotalea sp. PP2-459]|uniref:hypothetical protein n=1 Tax=Thalassotalea sp. PP2-459 TaxID=1742724 RepID=UPI000943E2F0|nr:hypothetical protein [Thalassotalea sp. PP2-459]OKY26756.1 hypothetical protein BI291_01825 [Thalassotalea sp. PP2-459]